MIGKWHYINDNTHEKTVLTDGIYGWESIKYFKYIRMEIGYDGGIFFF